MLQTSVYPRQAIPPITPLPTPTRTPAARPTATTTGWRTRGGGRRETGDTPADRAMRGGTNRGAGLRTTDTGTETGTGTEIEIETEIETGRRRETGRGTETETGETEDAEVAAETVMVGETDTVVVSVKNEAEAVRNLGKGQNQDLKRKTIRLVILHHQIKMIHPR